MAHQDPQNPVAATSPNDPAGELVEKVIEWYRGHRNLLTSAQQTNVINAITSILNGTFHV